MGFELRDHTADVAVAATGETLGDAFAAVADGLTAAMCEEVPDHGNRFDLSVEAEDREAVLFDFLDELIYVRDVENVLPADHEAVVEREGDRWRVRASARAVPLADVTAREVKAVTYSEMAVSETDDGWEVYVVFDV